MTHEILELFVIGVQSNIALMVHTLFLSIFLGSPIYYFTSETLQWLLIWGVHKLLHTVCKI